jgi:hypothetical protein
MEKIVLEAKVHKGLLCLRRKGVGDGGGERTGGRGEE